VEKNTKATVLLELCINISLNNFTDFINNIHLYLEESKHGGFLIS